MKNQVLRSYTGGKARESEDRAVLHREEEEESKEEEGLDSEDMSVSEKQRRDRAHKKMLHSMPTKRHKEFTVNFTVGRIEDGNAILLSQDHNLIDVPLMLLPKHIKPGNILKFQVERNLEMEEERERQILSIQD